MKSIKKLLIPLITIVLVLTTIVNVRAVDFNKARYEIKIQAEVSYKGQNEDQVFQHIFELGKDEYFSEHIFEMRSGTHVKLVSVSVNEGQSVSIDDSFGNDDYRDWIILDKSQGLAFRYDVSGNTGTNPSKLNIQIARRSDAHITANQKTVTYNGTEQTLSGFQIEGLREGHQAKLRNENYGQVSGTNVGDYTLNLNNRVAIIDQKGQDVTMSYNLSYTSGTLTINPADVTITVNNAQKVVGTDDPELSANVQGLIDGETLDYVINREVGEEVGEYEVTAEYDENNNYRVNVVNGILTITPLVIDEDPTEPGDTPVIDEPIENPDIETPITTPEVPVIDETTPIIEVEPAPVLPVIVPTVTVPLAVAPVAAAPVAPIVNNVVPAVQDNVQNTTTNENDDAEPIVEVEDNQTPLAGIGRTWALVNLIASIITVLLGIVVIIMKRKKEEDSEEENEESQTKKRYTWMKFMGAFIAMVSVIVFILTEDMTLPMAMLDKYTVVMIVIALIQCIVLFSHILFKKKEEQEEAKQA